MSQQGPNQELRELCWRARRSAADETRLALWRQQHPEHEAELQIELALTRSLQSLANTPVPSNFTARVLAECRQPILHPVPRRSTSWLRQLLGHQWLPRFGVAAVVLAATLGSAFLVRQHQQARMGQSVSVISEVAAVPGTEVWRDYDAIRVLHAPAADEELLALLQ